MSLSSKVKTAVMAGVLALAGVGAAMIPAATPAHAVASCKATDIMAC